MRAGMRRERDWLTSCASTGRWIVKRGTRHVPVALLCASTVACTAILGLSDKPLAEAAVDATAATKAILFGGYNEGDGSGDNDYYLNDTWSFDGHTWTKLAPRSSPSARSGSATTLLGSTMVIFGGTDDNLNDNNDLWSFGNDNWTEVDDGATDAPPIRALATLAALGNSLVLFGGFQNASTNDAGVMLSLNDTWVWNGTSWAKQKPTTSPPVRDSAVMATLNGKVLLFGGENSTPDTAVNLGDTWEWDGTNWAELHPAHTRRRARTAASRSRPRMASRGSCFSEASTSQATRSTTCGRGMGRTGRINRQVSPTRVGGRPWALSTEEPSSSAGRERTATISRTHGSGAARPGRARRSRGRRRESAVPWWGCDPRA